MPSKKGTGWLMRNPIMHTLVTLTGNPRACLWTEPLFGVPFNLFTPLAAVYMAALGLDPFMIGVVATVFLASQTVCAALGGVVTDKLGRRLTTAIFDIFAWIVPSVLWAVAQGPLAFVLAAFFNGFWRLTETSWSLLMTEDAEPGKIIHLYAITNIAGLIAGFVSPLTYLFVRHYSLVTTMRWLYALMALCMTIKTVLVYVMSTETQVGLRRLEENRGVSILSRLVESRFVLGRMFRERHIMLTIGLVAAFMLIKSVNDNFLPLLFTEKLGIPEENLSLFNTLRTLVMLVFYFVLVPRMDVRRFKKPLVGAMALLLAVDAVYFFLREGAMALIVVNVLMEAAALSILTPLLASLNMQVLDKEERARMFAFSLMMALLITTPFGTVAGWLSRLDRGLPMLLNIALAALSIGLALRLDHILLDDDLI
ncbi:MAG: MFS transporter [Clostridiales bacterium]|nr:MFS transporter [Clostridiales bacterium]